MRLQGVCADQPGLQPEVEGMDQLDLVNQSANTHQIMCLAKKLGLLSEVATRGVLG